VFFEIFRALLQLQDGYNLSVGFPLAEILRRRWREKNQMSKRSAGYATRQRVGGGVVRDPDRQIIPLL